MSGLYSVIASQVRLLTTSLLVLAAAVCTATWTHPGLAFAQAPAAARGDRTVVDVVSKLDETRTLLKSLSAEGIPQALKAIDGLTNLSAAEKESLKKEVTAFKELIDPHLVRLERYDSIFEKNDTLQKFVDYYGEYREMQETASVLTYKPQQDLAKLAVLLKNHGADVPIIGKALETYGAVTLEFMKALERVAQAVNEHMGFSVGIGSPLGYPPNEALQKQFPELWGRDTYTPRGPDFVYRSTKDNVPLLIYDKGTQTWYVVRPEASGYNEVELLYRDTLQFMERRLTGAELYRLTLAPTFEDIQERRKIGKSIRDYLNTIWFTDPDFEIITAVNTAADQAVSLPTHVEHKFQASFALDYRFRNQVWQRLKATFDGFWGKSRPDLAVSVRTRALVSWKYAAAQTWWCDGKIVWQPKAPRQLILYDREGGRDRIFCLYAPLITQDGHAGIASIRELKPIEFNGYNVKDIKITLQLEKVVAEPGPKPSDDITGVTFVLKASASGHLKQGNKVISYLGDVKESFGCDSYPGLQTLSEFRIDQPSIAWTWPSGKQDAVVAELPKLVTLELGGLTREIPVSLAAGGRLVMKASLSSANPFVVALGDFDRSRLTLLGERTEQVERPSAPGGKPLLGGASERRVYEFQAADAAGESRVVVEMRRPWERAASTRYTIVVTVGRPATPSR